MGRGGGDVGDVVVQAVVVQAVVEAMVLMLVRSAANLRRCSECSECNKCNECSNASFLQAFRLQCAAQGVFPDRDQKQCSKMQLAAGQTPGTRAQFYGVSRC